VIVCDGAGYFSCFVVFRTDEGSYRLLDIDFEIRRCFGE